jgi:transmembrane protein EpsG
VEKLFLIFVVLIFGLYYSSNQVPQSTDSKRRKYIIIITFFLILFSGLRSWNVGLNYDTEQYNSIFETVKATTWNEIIDNVVHNSGKDPFYGLFQKVFQVFTGSYQLYLLLVAVIIFSSFAGFIYKNTSQIRHAVVAFVFYIGYFYGFYSLTGTRQVLATAFLIWSFEYVKNKKIVPFLILNIVASLFHLSALVFIPIYFLANLKKFKLIIALAVLGFPLIFWMKNELAVFFVSFFGVEERFGVYAEQYERGGSLVLTTLYIFLGIISLFFVKRVLKINPDAGRLYNMYALSIFFYPLVWVNPSAGRISMYFSLSLMVLIPFILDIIGSNNLKIRQLVYGIALILFIILTLFTLDAGVTYSFFWQKNLL